jgi:hypothetical protein
MTRLFIVGLALISLSASPRAASAATTANDSLVVYAAPARRAGPIDSKTKRADLVRLFGKSRLKDSTIVLGEGQEDQATTEILDKTWAATVVWESSDRQDISSVIMSKQGTRWHTKEGIRIGTSVRELEKINGMPFPFSGLDWDFGGLIGETEGKLSKLDGLSLTLTSEAAPEDTAKFTGDRVNPLSNAAGIDKAGIEVGQMILKF